MEEAYTFKYIRKDDCTGCEACVNKCPVEAMSMIQDESGFYYPNTDYNKCISCNLCVGVCHRHKSVPRKDNCIIETLAGFSYNSEIVYNSSSGGMFRSLADEFMNLYPEGKICAVIWDDDFRGVHHEIGGRESLNEMQRSKYVQSRKKNVYVKVREYLENDIPILFVGCPCEVAALTMFLGKDYDNLIKLDFVCQGPTAPAVLESYVIGLERKYNSKIKYINLRLPGGSNWIPQWSEIRFDNGEKYVRAFYETDLGIAVHYMQREACYTCDIRGKNRYSDVTLGDFHGVSHKEKYYNSNGTSILCVNTTKGKQIMELVKRLAYLENVDYSIVEKDNKRLTEPRKKETADEIFLKMYKEEGLKKAIRSVMSWKKKIKYYLPTAFSNLINGYKGYENNEK